ncbi:hypothetical protein [Halostella litorea]|uniref:hypothetical protein n=1 Tax=Halostella litorea TaxID=2528831 RepID=UPI0010921E39|nr:hypothetical protein [Halostella litorea]
MPDENRFAGIGEAVEGDDPAADEATPTEADDDPVDEGGDAPADDSDGDSGDAGPDEGGPPDTTPAFAFDDTVQKSVYVRPETFEELEDAEALVDAQLRTDHDLRDLTRREFFDAVFREAAEDTDALVERVRRMREK